MNPNSPALVREVDGYVLQVHSVPLARRARRDALRSASVRAAGCAKAARLRRPFSVALPTYRCTAGYDHDRPADRSRYG